MSMTLEEMKLAVCEKLPELVETDDQPNTRWLMFWKCNGGYGRREIHWPTEGLQVCHEAEKLIHNECPETRSRWFIYLNSHEWAGLSATYEQRLEALCRVWFPERF